MGFARIAWLSMMAALLSAGCEAGPKGPEGSPGNPGGEGPAGATTFTGMTDHLSNSNILDNSISGEKIADQSLPGGKISPTTVTSLEIADGAIDTVHLGPLVVTSAQLVDASVTSAKLADLGVTTSKLADLSVTNGHIDDLAITAAKIADGAVISSKLALGAISSSNIADGTIVNEDLSATAAIAHPKLAILAASYSGRINNLSTASGTHSQYGGANGFTNATASQSDVTILSLNASCLAIRLAVKLTSPQGADDRRQIILSINGQASLVACGLDGGETSCSSIMQATVPAGSELAILIEAQDTGSNGMAPANLLFGWECR